MWPDTARHRRGTSDIVPSKQEKKEECGFFFLWISGTFDRSLRRREPKASVFSPAEASSIIQKNYSLIRLK